LKDIEYSANISFYEYAGGLKYLFLKKHAATINSSQIVFINTIANDFGTYLAIDRKNTTVLRVHNANKQFRPFRNLAFPGSWFFAWKFFSYILRQVVGKGFSLFRPLVNKRISYFTFPDSSITAYVKQHAYLDERKIIAPISLKITVEADTAYAAYKDVLNITIIGATDQRRRQYEETVAALIVIYKSADPPAIHLTLLGKSTNDYGQSIIKQLQDIAHPKLTLKTYNSQVPEADFIACLKETHIIISPITNQATTDIFKEVYGKTKTTGSILDFLKFGKVTLVPRHYQPPSELSDYIIKYDNSGQLAEIILALLYDKKINDLNQKSLAYVKQNYSKEVVLQTALNTFKSLLAHG
jgi:hypothetical protein